MKSFIKVIEYWVPTPDGSMLEFGGGYFGTANRFAALTRSMCFGRGEGLPGQVWERGHPIVLKALDDSYFRRAAAAKAEGLTCGIALPLFKGSSLSAVVVIFCGDDEDHAGAIELWSNQPGAPKDMTLVDGYYGTTTDTFEFISRSTLFRIGNGLPGMAWQKNAPVFLEDLGKGSGFLRADGAVKVGINRGFSFPCSTLDGSHQVLAFLSALATPIATGLEIWEPEQTTQEMQCSMRFFEPESPAHAVSLQPQTAELKLKIKEAFSTGVPAVTGSTVVIPVAPQGRITSVIALHF